MTTKQDRLKEVYSHLRAHHGIHTQLELAEVIHVTRPALSSAMNGNEAYLTKNLFQKICAAFPGVFDLDYLLTGNGSLLSNDKADHEEIKTSNVLDQSSLVNAAIAAKDETIINLKERIKELQRTIADKEEIIKARDARIIALERQLAAATTGDISHYPFTVGAAEYQDKSKM
jgi:transcriptional regulator with XRE-family HTH domain